VAPLEKKYFGSHLHILFDFIIISLVNSFLGSMSREVKKLPKNALAFFYGS
jgi:hypothetical protein